MKKSILKKISAVLMSAIAAIGIGTVAATPANAATTNSFIRCYFYANNQCYDHWIPTRDSCRDIGKYGTTDQLRSCLALFGYGVTKK